MWSQDTLLTADHLRSQTRYFTDCGWFAITNKIFYWLRMTCDHKILYWLRMTCDHKILYWLRIICDHKQYILLTADDLRSQTRYFTCDHKQDILLSADDMWSQDTLLTADDMWSQDTLLTADHLRSQTRYFTGYYQGNCRYVFTLTSYAVRKIKYITVNAF